MEHSLFVKYTAMVIRYLLKLLIFPFWLILGSVLLIWSIARIIINKYIYRRFIQELITYERGRYVLRYRDQSGHFMFDFINADSLREAFDKAISESDYLYKATETLFPCADKVLKGWWKLFNPLRYWVSGFAGDQRSM
jgi:hypothetical protein